MYQFNGVAQFTTILAWCYRHLDIKDWDTNGFETITFTNEKAYTLFMLRWG